jgi:hypothetical protein
MEFKNKNDYTIIFYLKNGAVYKMTYVHNILNAKKWFEAKAKDDYNHANVYVRRSGRFLFQFYKWSFVNPKPK